MGGYAWYVLLVDLKNGAGSYHDAQPEASCAELKSGSTASNVVSKAQKQRFTIVERRFSEASAVIIKY